MLVARMFDVVTDPLMGSLADRTQSRFGTYRPWLIYGAVPFGLVSRSCFIRQISVRWASVSMPMPSIF